MLQNSKLEKSRKEWREKAVRRAYQVREFRKTLKRHKKKITELKQEKHELKQTDAAKKIAELEKKNHKLKQANKDLKKTLRKISSQRK